jgi:hypothetical protein
MKTTYMLKKCRDTRFISIIRVTFTLCLTLDDLEPCCPLAINTLKPSLPQQNKPISKFSLGPSRASLGSWRLRRLCGP